MKASDMNGYVCVYRHAIPCRRYWLRTEPVATSNPGLRRFLDVYNDQGCFYDWGDDPSFFAASEMLGDVRKATWGVRRPDVRRRLKALDYVMFFCAKSVRGPVWEHFYIGVGTVSLGLTRQTI